MSGFKLKILSPNFSLLEVMCLGLTWLGHTLAAYSSVQHLHVVLSNCPNDSSSLKLAEDCLRWMCAKRFQCARQPWWVQHGGGFFCTVWASNLKAERPQRRQSSSLAVVHTASALTYNQTSRCSLVTHECFITFTPCFISSGFVLHINFREWD